jgi:hypothetical protein
MMMTTSCIYRCPVQAVQLQLLAPRVEQVLLVAVQLGGVEAGVLLPSKRRGRRSSMRRTAGPASRRPLGRAGPPSLTAAVPRRPDPRRARAPQGTSRGPEISTACKARRRHHKRKRINYGERRCTIGELFMAQALFDLMNTCAGGQPGFTTQVRFLDAMTRVDVQGANLTVGERIGRLIILDTDKAMLRGYEAYAKAEKYEFSYRDAEVHMPREADF